MRVCDNCTRCARIYRNQRITLSRQNSTHQLHRAPCDPCDHSSMINCCVFGCVCVVLIQTQTPSLSASNSLSLASLCFRCYAHGYGGVCLLIRIDSPRREKSWKTAIHDGVLSVHMVSSFGHHCVVCRVESVNLLARVVAQQEAVGREREKSGNNVTESVRNWKHQRADDAMPCGESISESSNWMYPYAFIINRETEMS